MRLSPLCCGADRSTSMAEQSYRPKWDAAQGLTELFILTSSLSSAAFLYGYMPLAHANTLFVLQAHYSLHLYVETLPTGYFFLEIEVDYVRQRNELHQIILDFCGGHEM